GWHLGVAQWVLTPLPGRTGELSLVALLPALRRRLGLSAELQVVKAPARYGWGGLGGLGVPEPASSGLRAAPSRRECSGLVLLSSCHRATEQLQRFFTDARRRGQYPVTYRAVTVGVPAEAEGEVRTGLCWQQQGDTAMVVPVPAPGHRSLARKEVKNTLTRYRVLGAAGGCALLQLQPRTGECPPPTPPSPHQHGPNPRASPAFPEQLPVHLTLLLCPALGDHEHSSRVGRVLGVPFLLPPEATPTRTQVLDEELLCRLGLSPQQLRRLPLHLHLQQLVLP
ncbi:RUSD3 synthase, partial [Podilymbus podiceps]|nr:RUSD3 synthase [Podilymbus podiceps]